MYHRILVPIDGSDTAQRGLVEAIDLAKGAAASIVLLHVIEAYPVLAETGLAAIRQQILDDQRALGRDLLDRAHGDARAAGIACESHLIDSLAARVADTIVEQARQHRCDLIVMGTHGRRGLDRLLMGSDAERVLRLVSCAVLLVRATGQT